MLVYRYISLDRFFSSLKWEGSNLFFNIRFNSAKYFSDPWEGLGNGLVGSLDAIDMEYEYTKKARAAGGYAQGPHTAASTFHKLLGQKGKLLRNEVYEALKFSITQLYSCWFLYNEKNGREESLAMWEMYAPKNGVLIAFELEKIIEVLKNRNLIFENKRVCYIDFLQAEFDKELHMDVKSLFLKDFAYDYEKEYRIILTGDNEPYNNVSNVDFIDINMPLPYKVILNPNTALNTINHLNKSVKDYGIIMKPSQLATKISRKDLLHHLTN